jgi:hypothetical protein
MGFLVTANSVFCAVNAGENLLKTMKNLSSVEEKNEHLHGYGIN